MKPTVEIRSDLGIDFADRLLKFVYEDVDKRKDKVQIQIDNRDLVHLEEYPPGSIVVARWGYPGNLTPWHVVQIKTVKGFEVLTFEGASAETILDRVERTEAYYGATHSQIVNGIAEKRYGFSGRLLHVEDTEVIHETVNQIGETDGAFLKRLAAENGFVFYVDDTGLHWHAAKYSDPPRHRIVYRRIDEGGEVIGEPRLEINLQRHFRKIKKKKLDPEDKGLLEALLDPTTDEEAPELGKKVPDDKKKADPLLIKDPETGQVYVQEGGLAAIDPKDPLFNLLPPKMQEAALQDSESVEAEPGNVDQQAKKKKRALAPLKIRFGLTVVGNPAYRAKQIYSIIGLPSLLEGNWYCPKAVHTIGEDYTIALDFKKQNLEKNPKKGKLDETGGDVNDADADAQGGEVKIVKDPDTGQVYQYPPGFIGPV